MKTIKCYYSKCPKIFVCQSFRQTSIYANCADPDQAAPEGAAVIVLPAGYVLITILWDSQILYTQVPGLAKYTRIDIKKIAFGNKEHTKDQQMGVSVLLRLFISSNKVRNTAYTL